MKKEEEEEEGRRRRRGRKVELGLASGNGPQCQAPSQGGGTRKRAWNGRGTQGTKERIGDLGAPKARGPGSASQGRRGSGKEEKVAGVAGEQSVGGVGG